MIRSDAEEIGRLGTKKCKVSMPLFQKEKPLGIKKAYSFYKAFKELYKIDMEVMCVELKELKK